MKRLGNLWGKITSFENLLIASKKAQKAKRFRDNVLEFNYNLEGNLFELQSQLKNKTYLINPEITEPLEFMIQNNAIIQLKCDRYHEIN